MQRLASLSLGHGGSAGNLNAKVLWKSLYWGMALVLIICGRLMGSVFCLTLARDNAIVS